MIIYFAGSGRKSEHNEKLLKQNSPNWGILLSYKDIKTKDRQGCSRFVNLKKLKDKKK